MIELADIFGYAGTVTAVGFMIPQVFRTYKTKSVEDISWGMLSVFLLNCFFWTTYGILENSMPVILANSIAGAVVLIQITLKILYRNNP
ncbi:hypothetical protein HY969_00340 [Candidatus Kaiserbacteria bacterium]|nr:hypothetical protein [Candidatus Kaiserbacteria bacterium]